MYETLLTLHNLLRWAVLIAAVVALARVLPGLSGRRAWTSADRAAGAAYTGLVSLQVVLGLLLYVGLSPLMRVIFSNFGAAMRDSQLRFFAVEHIFAMILAAVLATLGGALARRRATDLGKFRAAALCYGLSLLVIVIAIPWWRPLLRLWGYTA